MQSTKSNYISETDEPEIRKSFPNAQFAWIKGDKAAGSTWFHVEKHTEFMQAVVGFIEDSKINRSENSNATEFAEHNSFGEKQKQN